MSKKLVLVTGITGFIGAHVAKQLLQAGYHVRGTVRSMEKANELVRLNPDFKDEVEFVIVKDIVDPNAFEDAIKNVDYVCHVASPFFVDNIIDNKTQLLDPAVKGTLSVLEAAHGEKSVKRIVITSSFAAIINLEIDVNSGKVYTEKDWNPITYEQGISTKDGTFAYCASKTCAERAARDYVAQKHPSFDICTVNPPYVFGPPIQPMKNMDSLNTSNLVIWSLINGSKANPSPYYYYVDVRDLAAAHVLALENKKLSNGRMIACKGLFTSEEICSTLRNHFPDKQQVISKPEKASINPGFMVLDGSYSRSIGLKYRSDEECFVDTAKKLWERAEEFQKN